MRSKTAVLLDAGGVILDEAEYENAGARVIAGILSDSVPGYDLARYWMDTEESVQSHCPHTRDYIFWKRARGDIALFASIKARYAEEWKQAKPPLALMKGVETEIPALAERFRLVLCGQYGGEIMELLDQCGLAGYLSSRATQDDYSVTKPDPRYFEQICRRDGLDPEACIMVGDRIDKDVIPAKTVGMGTVFVRTGIYKNQRARCPSELPDLVLEGVERMARAIAEKWPS